MRSVSSSTFPRRRSNSNGKRSSGALVSSFGTAGMRSCTLSCHSWGGSVPYRRSASAGHPLTKVRLCRSRLSGVGLRRAQVAPDGGIVPNDAGKAAGGRLGADWCTHSAVRHWPASGMKPPGAAAPPPRTPGGAAPSTPYAGTGGPSEGTASGGAAPSSPALGAV